MATGGFAGVTLTPTTDTFRLAGVREQPRTLASISQTKASPEAPDCIVCASGIRKTVSGSTPAAKGDPVEFWPPFWH
jgi:hypothetical protein